jgi:hypothetical protein
MLALRIEASNENTFFHLVFIEDSNHSVGEPSKKPLGFVIILQRDHSRVRVVVAAFHVLSIGTVEHIYVTIYITQ